MKTRNVDPSLLEGEELERWYRRPTDQIEADREAERMRRFHEFFGPSDASRGDNPDTPSTHLGDGGWQEARAPAQFSMPAPPVETRVGAPNMAGVPVGRRRGGFFDTHVLVPNLALGPAYLTDLPRPLNVVTPKAGDWYDLGDGTRVKGQEEVERIHTEQQRRMRGEEDPEPPARVRSADRFRDGSIPRADQIEKGQRELDVTCHPYGGWERDPGFQANPTASQRYEAQITRAPGLDYVVRNPDEGAVKFDGCAVWDPRRPLLEAKGPNHEGLVERGRRWRFFDSVKSKADDQAGRQAHASRSRLVEWHIAEPGAVPFFRDVLAPYPSLRLRQTPAR